MEQFTSSKKIVPTSHDMYQLWKKQGESLQTFLARFNKEKLEILGCLEEIAINAFHMVLLPGIKLYGKLTGYSCKTF